VLESSVRRSEPVALSAVSLIEIAVLATEGKLRLNISLDEFFDVLRADATFYLLPLTFEIALEVASLRPLRDPVDHGIVATARVHRLQLVTSDQRIIESNLVPVVDQLSALRTWTPSSSVVFSKYIAASQQPLRIEPALHALHRVDLLGRELQ
jgi:PIN domain nuclease of toxin-antitoxin system